MNVEQLATALEVGVYAPTAAFREIPLHVAVMRRDLGLVAVCGIAGNDASEAYAQLFASAPKMLAALGACRGFLEDQIDAEPNDLQAAALLAELDTIVGHATGEHS